MRQTRGSETSQYPEEEKSNEILLVAASERGGAQTDPNTKHLSTRGNLVFVLCMRKMGRHEVCPYNVTEGLVLGLGL